MTDANTTEMRRWRRRAAALGPGYRGLRRPATDAERAAVAQALRDAGEEPPPYLARRHRWVDRRAKLFEAGDYPDKGVTLTADDLERLAAGFDLPAPLLIEHAETPLQMGYLTRVEALGDELFGVLALTEEADALVKGSGAGRLSIGLTPDLSAIREVSLVRHPRVADATLYTFAATLETADAAPRDVQGEAARLVADGRLTPAQSRFAASLLGCETTVRVGDDSRTIRDIFLALVDRQPPLALFSELSPDIPLADLPAEEVEFYRRHFPDVSLDLIAAKRRPA